MAANNLPDGLHVKALDDGNVEFVLQNGGATLAAGMATPEQVGTIVTNFLHASHNAFHNAEKKLGQLPQVFNGPAVPVTRWALGGGSQPNQQALIVEFGEAKIALSVTPNQVRDLGRYLIIASHNPQSALPIPALIKATARDLWAGLSGLAYVIRFRATEALVLYKKRFQTWICGRSLRMFYIAKVNVGSKPAAEYSAVDKCIYCDAEIYADPPVRQKPLGGEHIIPEGIGGNLELPESSCQRCETLTGAMVEGNVLGKTLKALRVYLNLKKAGSGPHPKVLPLECQVDGIGKSLSIPVDEYPILFVMLQYPLPSFVADATESGKTVTGFRYANLRYDEKALYKKYRVSGFSTAVWDQLMFCRMLAKIGHSFAHATIGPEKFKPMLLDLILQKDIKALSLIGSGERPSRKSSALHEIGLGYQRWNGTNYVVAKIRLFAKYNDINYLVVVGESLEGSTARAKRVFSNRISRMLSR